MTQRKEALVTGEIYHIFNKSIAGFEIFNSDTDLLRIKNVIRYYQVENNLISFSNFIKTKQNVSRLYFLEEDPLVTIIAYCIMPTHLHLVIKQLKDDGIEKFITNILNSYSRYFNIKHNRKGPLWEGRFKSVLVKSDEQLLHLTRYLHLNPVTSYLVKKPEEWNISSYKEYLSEVKAENALCQYNDIIDINPKKYKEFVEDRISYQRELAKIKDTMLE